MGFAAGHGVAADLAFRASADGGFTFNNGILKGRLRAGGASLGLQEVVYLPSTHRVDGGNGLMFHDRVLARGQRFGDAAWKWPSTAVLRPDGGVAVTWAVGADRPFELAAVYRWVDESTLEVETRVRARADLEGFEVSLVSHHDAQFHQAAVCVSAGGAGTRPEFRRAAVAQGEWQIFPRDAVAEGWIRDGRWGVEPEPIAWTVPERLALTVARRRAPVRGLSGLLMVAPGECFALGMKQETEGPFPLYASLFGRDLKAGDEARSRARYAVAVAKSDVAVIRIYEATAGVWSKE